MSTDKKQYGLIIPSKVKEAAMNFRTRRVNPLIDSDDELEKDEEESENTLDWIEQTMKKSAGNSGVQSLQKRRIKEAFKEDSTIFQYDEIYDQMKESSQDAKKKELERKPKYIHTILKHTEQRKLENERRQERKVQKERDAEGDEFADKESFVTASYLKKLEEMKIAEEKERMEKYMEDAIDVHKHKNFGVFFNHILKQRVGEKETETPVIKQEPEEEEEEEHDDDSSAREPDIERPAHFNKMKDSRKKAYRTHREESESPSRSKSTARKSRKRSNSFSGNDENAPSLKERKESHTVCEKIDIKSEEIVAEEPIKEKVIRKSIKDLPMEERIDKYEVTFSIKSTGEIFKDLLQRYFQRKAAKDETS